MQHEVKVVRQWGTVGSSWQAVYKVADNALAVLSDDALRVELHALHVWVPPVPNPHDGPILGPRRDFQVSRQALLLNHQAVVAAGVKGAAGRQAGKGRCMSAGWKNGRQTGSRQAGRHKSA